MLGVIIPVYNRPDNLRMALKSLELQTKDRFFTIVVDDCSEENIKEVCNEFNSLHLKYIRLNKNSGPGAARQIGLNFAYKINLDSIIFLDSDDRLCPNAVERLSYELNHSKSNLIVSDIITEHKNKPDFLKEGINSMTWLHGKIYRTSFLQKNNICFPIDFKTNEDLAFNLCVYNAIEDEDKKYIPQQLYLWRDDNDSITHNNELASICNGIDFINAVYFYFNYCKNNMQPIKKPNILLECYYYYQLTLIRDNNITEEVDEKLKEMFSHYMFIIPLSNRDNWYNLWTNNFAIYEKKFYFFKETLYDWLNRLEFDFSILGE